MSDQPEGDPLPPPSGPFLFDKYDQATIIEFAEYVAEAREKKDLARLRRYRGSRFEHIRDLATEAILQVEAENDERRHREQVEPLQASVEIARKNARTANLIAGLALLVSLLALFRDRLGF